MESKRYRPEEKDLKPYLLAYADRMRAALEAIPASALDAFRDAILAAIQSGKRIFVAGNGGSAAIADHLCCDFMKGTAGAGHSTLRTQSLVSNTALLTAIANDHGYEESFRRQVELQGEAGDLLILISSSGKSPNILAAAHAAQARGMKVVGLSGFSGGELAKVSDVSIHVAVDNYGIVEDAHQSIMHVTAQWIARSRGLA